MFAHIKFLKSGKYKTVDVSKIINYKPDCPTKIFKIEEDGIIHKTVVVAVHDSIQELSEIVESSRQKAQPLALLSEPSEENLKVKKKTDKLDNTLNILNSRLLRKDPERFNMENVTSIKEDIQPNDFSENKVINSTGEGHNPKKRKIKAKKDSLKEKECQKKSKNGETIKKIKTEQSIKNKKSLMIAKDEKMIKPVILVIPNENEVINTPQKDGTSPQESNLSPTLDMFPDLRDTVLIPHSIDDGEIIAVDQAPAIPSTSRNGLSQTRFSTQTVKRKLETGPARTKNHKTT
ncbi:uncharacterized protein LOC130670166 [Microplitis mediator]|uniref:uncharacterized protein LOC130670166 n=1 Tax=Microplitis mediator TaxID=375433 RepID=UPI0025545EA9|nr:uncharacterized protein LOC130670166 [Microplitis mediator]